MEKKDLEAQVTMQIGEVGALVIEAGANLCKEGLSPVGVLLAAALAAETTKILCKRNGIDPTPVEEEEEKTSPKKDGADA